MPGKVSLICNQFVTICNFLERGDRMPVFGVICEYDPFHLGHRWMLEQLHRQGPVVCAMSGCFTQRGEFAAVNKFARAEMAVRNGADLVLELPLPWAVSSV